MVERGQLKMESLLQDLPALPAVVRSRSHLVDSDSDSASDSDASDSAESDSDSEAGDNSTFIRNWRAVPPIDWTPPQTAQWVFSLGPRFAMYSPLFSSNSVSGSLLLGISEDNLLSIGVRNFRDRRELQGQVEKLRTSTANGSLPGTSALFPFFSSLSIFSFTFTTSFIFVSQKNRS
jgi:hypothetical protein